MHSLMNVFFQIGSKLTLYQTRLSPAELKSVVNRCWMHRNLNLISNEKSLALAYLIEFSSKVMNLPITLTSNHWGIILWNFWCWIHTYCFVGWYSIDGWVEFSCECNSQWWSQPGRGVGAKSGCYACYENADGSWWVNVGHVAMAS